VGDAERVVQRQFPIVGAIVHDLPPWKTGQVKCQTRILDTRIDIAMLCADVYNAGFER
jgi:hypothetical protein